MAVVSDLDYDYDNEGPSDLSSHSIPNKVRQVEDGEEDRSDYRQDQDIDWPGSQQVEQGRLAWFLAEVPEVGVHDSVQATHRDGICIEPKCSPDYGDRVDPQAQSKCAEEDSGYDPSVTHKEEKKLRIGKTLDEVGCDHGLYGPGQAPEISDFKKF